MPPRGRRSKKKDHCRIEAAIETMKTEYGIFDVEVVKKVLNNLLEEYGGGEEAWYFIELYTYQELLEGIVRYREENLEENNLPVNSAGRGDSFEENSLRIETVEKQAIENAAGSSTEPICSEAVDSSLVEYRGWKDIGLDKTSRNKEEISCSNEDVNTGSTSSAVQLIPGAPLTSRAESQLDSCLFLLSPCLSDTAPPRKHFWPCYGWIGNDEEEGIDEFMDLKPAKTTVSRRSRWDLRPEDP